MKATAPTNSPKALKSEALSGFVILNERKSKNISIKKLAKSNRYKLKSGCIELKILLTLEVRSSILKKNTKN